MSASRCLKHDFRDIIQLVVFVHNVTYFTVVNVLFSFAPSEREIARHQILASQVDM